MPHDVRAPVERRGGLPLLARRGAEERGEALAAGAALVQGLAVLEGHELLEEDERRCCAGVGGPGDGGAFRYWDGLEFHLDT